MGHSWTGRQIDYVSKLPENSVVIEQYDNKFEFEGLYFHGGLFYKDTDNGDYKVIPTYICNGLRCTNIRDKFGMRRTIMYDKLLKQYGLN